MSNVYGVSEVSSVTRVSSDGPYRALRVTRDGAAVTQDWLLSAAVEGRVFVANAGTVTTPITWAAGTIVTTTPDFDLSVPAGTLVIPVEIRVYMEAFGSSAQFETMAAAGTGGAQAGLTSITPKNLRADAPNASVCTAGSDGTGATYMTGNVSEFWRDGQQFAMTKTAASATVAASDPNLFIWRYSDSGVAPVLYSSSAASRLNVFAAGQAGTGFITVTWVELPQAAIG